MNAARALAGVLDPRFGLPVLAAFAGFVGFGSIVPVLPVHVRTDLGASDVELGMVVGSFSIAALSTRLLSGRLVDARGGLPGLILGLVLCSAAGALFLLPLGLPGVVVARMTQGFGNAFLFASAAALVVALTPPDQRARALGLLGIGTWGGLAVGPIFGALIGSFAGTALFVLVLPIPVLAVILRALPRGIVASPPAGDSRPRMFPREAILPGVALGLNSICSITLTAFLVLRMAEIGGGGALAYGAFATSVLATRVLLGSQVDRAGPAAGMLFGSLCCSIGLILVGVAPLPAVGIAGAILTGIGFGFPWLAIATFTLGRVGEREKGGTIGVLTLLSDAFMFGGATAAGAIAGVFGYSATFWFAGTSGLLSAVMVLPSMRASRARTAARRIPSAAPSPTEVAPDAGHSQHTQPRGPFEPSESE